MDTNTKTAVLTITPPTLPSIVFLGLISGISLLFLPETDISYQIDYFAKMCSVFTHTQFELQRKNLNDSGINMDKINFADSNTTVTIGKYKYTVISNAYSITLSCDRI